MAGILYVILMILTGRESWSMFFCLQRINQEDDVAVVSWWFLWGLLVLVH